MTTADERASLEAAVRKAKADMQRAAKRSKEADQGESCKSKPPCPMPDNKDGVRRYLSECWTDKHLPKPTGWPEFLAMLDATAKYSAARFRLECFERRQAKATKIPESESFAGVSDEAGDWSLS